MRPLVSVVIPMFNEEKFISSLLLELTTTLNANSIIYEIIVVDDCSTDNSLIFAKQFAQSTKNFKIITLSQNKGKGFAVQRGIEVASGQHVLIQDADNEYFPSDIPLMLQSMMLKPSELSVVYGSRPLGARHFLSGIRSFLCLWPKQKFTSWAFNLFLTLLFYAKYRVWVTDLLTGYKLYPTDIFKSWQPKTMGFETDHEITLYLHSIGFKIKETPIHYEPRSKVMGKKIGPRDAVRAIKVLLSFDR